MIYKKMIQMKSKRDRIKDLRRVRRRKFKLLKEQMTTDEFGNQVEELSDWKTLRGQKLELYGEERYAVKQFSDDKRIKFKLKYVPFLDEVETVGYAVEYDDWHWNITNTDTLNDDGQWFIVEIERDKKVGDD